MRIAFLRLAPLIAAFLFGCTAEDPGSAGGGCGTVVVDPLAAITVAEAHLEGLELWQAGLIAGRTDGVATLVVTDVDGNELEFDAMIRGGHAGLVMDASVDVAFDNEFPLILPPNTPITVRGLLGNYSGTHVGIDLIAGFHWRELQNASLVRLNVTTLSFGLGFTPMTWETVGLQLFDDPLEFVDDPNDCTSPFGPCVVDDDDGFCSDGDGFCDDACGDTDCTCEDEGDCEEFRDDLGQACDFYFPGDPGSCFNDLVCVRRGEYDLVGVCRLPCGDDPAICGALGEVGSTCQDATVVPGLAVEAVVCLDQFGADAPCAAAFDLDACADGFECRPAGAGLDDLRCKETCNVGKGGSDVDACVDPLEQCVPVGSIGGRGLSTCGVTVAPLPARLAVRTPLDQLDERLVCNEREERRYCDQSMFDDATATATATDQRGVSLCVTFSPFNGDGFCFPMCSIPTIDRNGDGVIDDVEKGATFECAQGLACTPSLAIATGIYDAPPTFPNGSVPRSCDPTVCPEGAACAACGVGDATCSTALGEPLCLAPFGACEPL